MTRSLARILAGVLAAYLTVPLGLFVLRALTTPERGFHVPGLVPALLISVSCATASLALVVLTGVPLAYLLARSSGFFARLIETLVTLPLALPPVMGGIVMVYLVGPYSSLGRLFHGQLTESVYGIVIAMTFTSAPFLVLSARAAFSVVDPVYLDVASTLGHSRLSRFVRVTLPLASPGIRAGMTMTWLRAFGEYGAVTILAYNPASLPVYTENQFMARGLNPTLAPTLLSLALAGVVVVLARVKLPGRHPRQGLAVRPHLATSAPPSFEISHDVGTFHLEVHHHGTSDTLAVLGPSGSGKSVLLRCLTGLYGNQVGRVTFGRDDVSARPPEHRSVGYVAQGFSLFPHLTVWRNVTFAVTASPDTARYWLDQLGVGDLDHRRPGELSGGQRQRVALAQALASSPDVLILDEPFSALDAPVRRELQRELRRLQRDTGLALIVVTHDPDEATMLARHLIILDQGRALQSGVTAEVLRAPSSVRVAHLLQRPNVLEVRVVSGGLEGTSGGVLRTSTYVAPLGSHVLLEVLPEQWRLHRPQSAPLDVESLTGEGVVEDAIDLGVFWMIEVRVDDEWTLRVNYEGDEQWRPGDPCILSARTDDLRLWQPSNES